VRKGGPPVHPKRVERCGEFFGPLEKKEMEGCAREFFYASPFAPVLPQYYVVRFDANNHVKGKTPYTSPYSAQIKMSGYPTNRDLGGAVR